MRKELRSEGDSQANSEIGERLPGSVRFRLLTK